jgi:hypothetical protein
MRKKSICDAHAQMSQNTQESQNILVLPMRTFEDEAN